MIRHMKTYLMLVIALTTLPSVFSADKIPPESAAWLSVHFSYPVPGKKSFYRGRVGPGFEIHKIATVPNLALVVIFPSGATPTKKYLQDKALVRFVKEWDRINLMAYRQDLSGDVRGAPFDDRTMVITTHENGVVTTLSIYAPEFTVEALKERPAGEALGEAFDLLYGMIGEALF